MQKSPKFVAHSKPNRDPFLVAAIACLFIAVALGLSLALSSCATNPNTPGHEPQLYLCLSNALVTGKAIAPVLPAPASTVLEGVLALGGALLALWATHIHRSVAEIKNGNGSGAPKTPAPAPQTPGTGPGSAPALPASQPPAAA